MQKQHHIVSLSLIWFFVCLATYKSNDFDLDHNQNNNSESFQVYLCFKFSKRGQAHQFDLNSSPPVEEDANLTKQQDHDIIPPVDSPSKATSILINNQSLPRLQKTDSKLRKKMYIQRKRKKQKALWDEAKGDSSKMTPDLQKQMDRHLALRRIRQQRYQRNMAEKAKENNFASEAQSLTWHRMRQTPEWRAKSSENEAKHQEHVEYVREWRKRKNRIASSKKDSLRKRGVSSYSSSNQSKINSLSKRAGGLDIDLNSSPPTEHESVAHDSNDEISTAHRTTPASTSIPKKKGGRKKIFTVAELKARKNAYQREKRREQYKLWNEAKEDPAKLTPEIQMDIAKHYTLQRNRNRRYNSKIALLIKSGESLTEQQTKAYQRKRQSPEWRAASSANEAKYQNRLKRERERQHKRRKIKKAEGDDEGRSMVRKRGLDADIDLNKLPFEVQQSSSSLPVAAAHNLDNQSPEEQAGVNRVRKRRQKMTPEEKKEQHKIYSRNFRARRKARFDEARKNPDNVKPEVMEEMQRYYKHARGRTKKYYRSLNAKFQSNIVMTPSELKVFHEKHKTKNWRTSSAKNAAAYQRHLAYNRVNWPQVRENKKKKKESKLQRRGISSNASPDPFHFVRAQPGSSGQFLGTTPTPSQGAEEKNYTHTLRSQSFTSEDAIQQSSYYPLLQKRATDTGIDLNTSPPKEDSGGGQHAKVDVDDVFQPRKRKRISSEERRRRNMIQARIRRRKQREEAMKDPSYLKHPTQEEKLAIREKSKAIRKENLRGYQRKLYHGRMNKAKSGQKLTPAELKYFHVKKKTYEWQKENPKAYELYLRKKREGMRKARALKRFGDDVIGKDNNQMQKRALDPKIDLNELPPESKQESTSLRSQSGARVAVKKRPGRKPLAPDEKKRRNKEAVKAYQRRKRAKWKEALLNPSLMTPKISADYTKFLASARQRSHKYYQLKLEKQNEGKELTPAQVRKQEYMNTRHKWKMENSEEYEAYLKQLRDRRRTATTAKQSNSRGDTGMEKRALDPGIDLNELPTETEGASFPPTSGTAPEVAKNGRVGRVVLSPEERKRRRSVSKKAYAKRERIKKKEALANPTKMNQKIMTSIMKSLESDRRRSQRYYRKKIHLRKGGDSFPPAEMRKQERLIHRFEWSEENLNDYKAVLEQLKKSKKAAAKADKENNFGLKKRALDPDIDLNKSPPKVQEVESASTPEMNTFTTTPRKFKTSEKERLRKRLERHRREKVWREAREDPSLMTPALQDSMDRHSANHRKRSKEFYRKKTTQKAKAGHQLSPIEQKFYDRTHRTAKWRTEIAEDYARFLKRGRDRRKKAMEDRDVSKAQNYMDSIMHKRGLDINLNDLPGLGFNLNELPPEHEHHGSLTHGEYEDRSTERKLQRKRRKRELLSQSEKKRLSMIASENRRRRKAILREAMNDPSKITPEIQATFERQKQTQRRAAKRAYHRINQRFKDGQPLTPAQTNRYNAIHRTKLWREDPANLEKYKMKLELDRGRKRKQKVPRINKNDQKITGEDENLHKRGLDTNIDLNKIPPRDESEALPSKAEQATRAQAEGQEAAGPRRSNKRPNKTTQSRRESEKRKRLKWREALNDPSTLTPEMGETIRKDRERNRKTSKIQQQRLKAIVQKKGPLTPAQVKRYQSINRSKEWREATPQNRANYERHKQRMRERYHLKKAHNNKNSAAKDNLQKRALDPSIDLNDYPPEHPLSSSNANNEHAPTQSATRMAENANVVNVKTQRGWNKDLVSVMDFVFNIWI